MTCIWHGSFVRKCVRCVTHLIHVCGIPHSYVRCDSYIHMAWLFRIYALSFGNMQCGGCATTHSCVRHYSFMCAVWLIDVWGITHSYVWCDSYIHVAWLFRAYAVSFANARCVGCATAHSCVWCDSFMCEALRIHTCGVTHAYMWHDSFVHKWSILRRWGVWVVPRLIHVWGIARSCV